MGSIRQHQTGGVVHVAIVGALDRGRVRLLRATLDDLATRGLRRVVLDCGEITQVDLPGLDDLHGCLAALRRAGGDLKLAAIPGDLSPLFATRGVFRAFDVYDSVRDATRGFGAIGRSR